MIGDNEINIVINIIGSGIDWIKKKLKKKFGKKIKIYDSDDDYKENEQNNKIPTILLNKLDKSNIGYTFNIDNKNEEHKIYREIDKILEKKIYGIHCKGYDILGILGKGFSGTVFLVKDKKTKQKQAMKVEKILEKDLKQNLESPIWREIEFIQTMQKKYPQQFIELYNYENKKCTYKHSIDYDINYDQKNNMRELLDKSPYCSIKWYEIIDDTVKNISKNITSKQVALDFLIQIMNIVYVLDLNGYVHTDLHTQNFGVIKTKDKYIEILGKKIPTYGYIIKAIDYGKVLHEKYELNEWEKSKFSKMNDFRKIFGFYIVDMYYVFIEKKYPHLEKNFVYPQITSTPEQTASINKYLKRMHEKKWGDNKIKILYVGLYKILYPNEYAKQNGINEKIELFDFIPQSSIDYMFDNFFDIKKILQHLIDLSQYYHVT